MLKRLDVLALALVILLWFVALILFLGPIYQLQCEGCAYNESYQERLTSLDCLFIGLFVGALKWVGRNSAEISAAITATATIAIAFFTETLWRATTQQGELTRESINLARAEFVSTHRPKIRVRKFVLRYSTQGAPTVTVKYEIINIGNTKATTLLNDVTIRFSPIGTDKPIEVTQSVTLSKEMPGGEWCEVALYFRPNITKEALVECLTSPEDRIIVTGFSHYQDDNGITRRTGFYRIWDPTNGGRLRHAKPIDPDYEYED
jgi:hypothetical protein